MIQCNLEQEAIGEFFHMVNNVKIVRGSIFTPEGKSDITQYTTCMSLDNLVYYYNTYNNRINAIHMLNEDLEGTEIRSYEE